jgi:hypothetical protein
MRTVRGRVLSDSVLDSLESALWFWAALMRRRCSR